MLEGCSITHTEKEGVLVQGTHENAATRAQKGLRPGTDMGNAATRGAEAWGKEQGIELQVGGLSGSCWHRHTHIPC